MADFTKTISNTLALFGGRPADKWGDMLWGELWGFGSEEFINTVFKVYANSITLDDSLALQNAKVVTNSLSVSGDMASEYLYDSAGYIRLFVNKANAEQRPQTSYSLYNSSTTSTYVTVTIPSTSWNEI